MLTWSNSKRWECTCRRIQSLSVAIDLRCCTGAYQACKPGWQRLDSFISSTMQLRSASVQQFSAPSRQHRPSLRVLVSQSNSSSTHAADTLTHSITAAEVQAAGAAVPQQAACNPSRRQLLRSIPGVFLLAYAGVAAADEASLDLEKQLPGLPQAAPDLPKAYQRTMHRLVKALRQSIEAEAAGAKEFEVGQQGDCVLNGGGRFQWDGGGGVKHCWAPPPFTIGVRVNRLQKQPQQQQQHASEEEEATRKETGFTRCRARLYFTQRVSVLSSVVLACIGFKAAVCFTAAGLVSQLVCHPTPTGSCC